MCAGSHFGAVVSDVAKTPYKIGDTVKVTFQSACPRNNVRTGDTFLAVQKLDEETGDWTTVSAQVSHRCIYCFLACLLQPRHDCNRCPMPETPCLNPLCSMLWLHSNKRGLLFLLLLLFWPQELVEPHAIGQGSIWPLLVKREYCKL